MNKIVTIGSTTHDSIAIAVEKLNKNKSLKINGLYASELIKLEKDDPKLFSQVADMINAGRWCPYAGVFAPVETLSSTALIKSCLYSTRYFITKFGKEYRVFHGTKIYNNSLAQTVYASMFDAAVIDGENETHWLASKGDDYITLIVGTDTADVTDELQPDCEYITYEEYAEVLFSEKRDFDTSTVVFGFDSQTELEKKLLDAEKSDVINGRGNNEKLTSAWIAYISGDIQKADKLASELDTENADTTKLLALNGQGIELSEIKYTEDGSGDIIVRTRETAGEEKGAFLMCDKLNAGFRFEIMPYEIQTFRIKCDGTGIATEIYICE